MSWKQYAFVSSLESIRPNLSTWKSNLFGSNTKPCQQNMVFIISEKSTSKYVDFSTSFTVMFVSFWGHTFSNNPPHMLRDFPPDSPRWIIIFRPPNKWPTQLTTHEFPSFFSRKKTWCFFFGKHLEVGGFSFLCFFFECKKNNKKNIWVFPKIGVPQNGWFIMENPIKMGWFGGFFPYLMETSMLLTTAKCFIDVICVGGDGWFLWFLDNPTPKVHTLWKVTTYVGPRRCPWYPARKVSMWICWKFPFWRVSMYFRRFLGTEQHHGDLRYPPQMPRGTPKK